MHTATATHTCTVLVGEGEVNACIPSLTHTVSWEKYTLVIHRFTHTHTHTHTVLVDEEEVHTYIPLLYTHAHTHAHTHCLGR